MGSSASSLINLKVSQCININKKDWNKAALHYETRLTNVFQNPAIESF